MQTLTLISNLVIPLVLCAILVHGLYKGVPVFDTFIAGAKEGLGISLRLLPTLVGLMTAIKMFSASGAFDILSSALAPLADLLQMPKEIIPLALMHPISGSGAMAIFQNILETLGPDSMGGRMASVMMGSAETTFYTIAVYYGATSVQDTRHTVPASLAADIAGCVASVFMVRLLFY